MKKEEITICVHGGHAEVGSRGASGYIDEVTCNRWMSDEICTELRKHGYKVYEISVENGTQSSVLYELHKRSFEKNATHNISCHFNSAMSNFANGFEIWTTHGNVVKEFLISLSNAYCKFTKQVNRGLKNGGSLYVCNNLENCILVEFAFVVNFCDSKKYSTERKCRRKARKFARLYIKHYLKGWVED